MRKDVVKSGSPQHKEKTMWKWKKEKNLCKAEKACRISIVNIWWWQEVYSFSDFNYCTVYDEYVAGTIKYILYTRIHMFFAFPKNFLKIYTSNDRRENKNKTSSGGIIKMNEWYAKHRGIGKLYSAPHPQYSRMKWRQFSNTLLIEEQQLGCQEAARVQRGFILVQLCTYICPFSPRSFHSYPPPPRPMPKGKGWGWGDKLPLGGNVPWKPFMPSTLFVGETTTLSLSNLARQSLPQNWDWLYHSLSL
jgi:hypothetical protein